MKLKWQISIIAILSLSFPWVVWQAFISLNQTFQNNMLAAANKQAQVIVNSVEQFHKIHPQDLNGLVAVELNDDAQIDGLFNEWTAIPWYQINHRIKFKLGQLGDHIHVLVEVQDNSYYTDLNQAGDRLIVAIGERRGIKKLTLNRQPEGPVFNQLVPSDVNAYWHETAAGYQVEIGLDGTTINRLGLAAVNHATADSHVSFGHLEQDQIQLHGLFKPQPSWQQFLQSITPEDGQIVLTDPQNRIYYQTQQLQAQPAADWLSEMIYEMAFDQDQKDNSHFFGQRVFQPFEAGQITLTTRHTASQMALIQTSLRAVFWIFIIALALLLGYFIYAMILAWRINRLNKKLYHVLDDKGRIHTSLPSNHAKDEIGDLSRGLAALFKQIGEYTTYLKQLGSRLSHEMKTPISIVHTSLENLHMEQPENAFVSRALTANNRLKFILNQLSALSKMKQSISETEQETFELNAFLSDLTQGYQLNHTHITFEAAGSDIKLRGSRDLLAQMLDKLIQNALDFTGPDDWIRIATSCSVPSNQYHITVTNSGSQLDEDHIPQLFDSLTSFRQGQSTEPHLGLGLYIVKLICEFHQYEIKAHNLRNPSAVQFKISGTATQW